MFDIEKARKKGLPEESIKIMIRVNENTKKRDSCAGHVFENTENIFKYHCKNCGCIEDGTYVSGYRDALKHYGKNEWIPVTEKLPKADSEVRYLVICRAKSGRKGINMAWYDGVYWHGMGSMASVTHWQPLPELPQEEPEEALLGEDISPDGHAKVYGYREGDETFVTRSEYSKNVESGGKAAEKPLDWNVKADDKTLLVYGRYEGDKYVVTEVKRGGKVPEGKP